MVAKSIKIVTTSIAALLGLLCFVICCACCAIVFSFLIILIVWSTYPSNTCNLSIEFAPFLNSTLASQISYFSFFDFLGTRINQVQYLGTHNSYHIQSPTPILSSLKYTHEPLPQQLERGVRHLEIDGHFNRNTKRWVVYHIALVDTYVNCGPCMADCLHLIWQWSVLKNQNHSLIIIHIEPKYEYDMRAFCNEPNDEELFLQLEKEVLSIFPLQSIVVPNQIQQGYSTMREAVQSRGWPNTASTRGKFLFVLNVAGANENCRPFYEKKVNPLLFMRTPLANVNKSNFTAFIETEYSDPSILSYLNSNYFIRTLPGLGATDAVIQQILQSGIQLLATDFYHPLLNFSTTCNPIFFPSGSTNCTL